ncbi:MAG TPA: hypothetical protein VE863_00365 [Pyrinomonadaceae bacterium]|jgi:hypothetical protein|nr:hypothetical protein [Pyrinomonadaceae bacterium]
MRMLVEFIVLILIVSSVCAQQSAPQTPSPMTDHVRPHPRILQTSIAGERFDLTSLKGARLFVGPHVDRNKPVPLMIHFHGAPWLVERHIASSLPRAALITVQLGAGSSAYGRPFQQTDLFRNILLEASEQLHLKHGWSSITLSGFSAGYAAVRQILRSPEYFALVNNVLLLDGMHASYVPEGKPLADGGAIDPKDLDSFISFAKEAVRGNKNFVVTHSEIFPGAYASTTECADFLLSQLGIQNRPTLRQGPVGMQQLSAIDRRGLHMRGYAGNSAPDHIDFLHGMPAWFSLLHIR